MRIGDLATASCTSVESIRYYERGGLLPVPARRLEKELQRAQCASPRAADACGIPLGLSQGSGGAGKTAANGHHRHDDLLRSKARASR